MMALLKALLLPPTVLVLLGLAGLALRRRAPRLGKVLAWAAFGALYMVSTPFFGSLALSALQPAYVDPRARGDAQAIVALGGGSFGPAPEYGADTVSHLTLVRARYAAHLQRLTGKPLLLSGGSPRYMTPEALQMRAVVAGEMNVPVRWIEDRSVDTFTNALESQRILAPQGIDTIYLVTHAWHLPRARLAFEHAGFKVLPAPTGYARFDLADLAPEDFLPRPSALLNSYYFFHEILGYVAYMLRVRL
ncbi:MAG: YdcF family protein [Burkholderiales bacterium]|nr:YdcF family protein [Burkholderiales bacterium]